MLDAQWIRREGGKKTFYVSRHADQERQRENLSIDEIAEALAGSRILEQYQDTGRGEGCLLVGFANSGKPIHAVCGRHGTGLVIVTVYIPMPPKFKNPYERGRP